MLMFAVWCYIDVFLIVDLLLIYINSVRIVVVVEVLIRIWTELNNCRFYLFFISALSFFFQNSCFSQRWKCWIEVICRLFSDDSGNFSLFVDGVWSNSRTTFSYFYYCWILSMLIWKLIISDDWWMFYDVVLLILVDNNSEKLLICFACLRCPFSCHGRFLLSWFKIFFLLIL